MNEPDPVAEHMHREMQADLQEKIKHILGIYPCISPTMLQAGLGAYIKPTLWRPVLEAFIKDGTVIESHINLSTPAGRTNTYTKLSLAEKPVEPI